MIPVSVLILTRNEETNLPGCLRSLTWTDDVVVFDSYSTDDTVRMAREAGARVVQRTFDDFGSQRSAALREVEYRYPWVLVVDADERPDPELVTELARIGGRPDDSHAAYRMRRKDHFRGRWIRHATLYPTWFVRLVRPGSVETVERLVHEYPVVKGTTGELAGHLIHDSFSKGIDAWLEKHRTYAALEAAEQSRRRSAERLRMRGLLSRDPVRRRRVQKRLAIRLPFRPLGRFMYTFVVRGGFLDGRPGFEYSRLLMRYEAWIVEQSAHVEPQRGA